AKGMNAFAASLLQCYLGILNAVFLTASILAVVKILRIAVGQQNQGLQARRPPVELLNRMSDRRSHACAAIWFERIDAVFDHLRIALLNILYHKELDVFAAISQEPVEGILIPKDL